MISVYVSYNEIQNFKNCHIFTGFRFSKIVQFAGLVVQYFGEARYYLRCLERQEVNLIVSLFECY